jgi:chemotaxis protein CheD
MYETSPSGGPPRRGETQARSVEEPVPVARTYLNGGQVHIAEDDQAITTILGSCVAVCLFDPVAKVGGMNHFLLPRCQGREPSPRFGDIAMRELLERTLMRGARRGRLLAKVFGGACAMKVASGRKPLGEENVELALEFLAAERIPVEQRDVGGASGRKLVFRAGDGAAWVKPL